MADTFMWKEELAKAHLIQEDIAKHLRISKQAMSSLKKTMILGKGLTANDKDRERWAEVLDYIAFKQSQVNKEK